MEALSVLVVEDDANVAELLAELLSELGYVVCAIESTEEGAVAAAARHSPDLVIVDAQLGRGSGIGAVVTMLRTGPRPHVFVSGNIAEVLKRRPDAVALQKPYTEATLMAAMDRALATHRQR